MSEIGLHQQSDTQSPDNRCYKCRGSAFRESQLRPPRHSEGKRQTVVLEDLDLSDRMSVTPIAFSLPMLNILSTPLATLRSILRSRAALELENLALRHQIGVLRRSARRRAKLTQLNRLFWAWLSRIWSDWRSALTTVQPESVRAWHRRGFDLYRAWKIRRGQPGRPTLADEVRELIRRMCRENPAWGAPRIHGELLKLGIDIGETG
jgi:hypothetical protein